MLEYFNAIFLRVFLFSTPQGALNRIQGGFLKYQGDLILGPASAPGCDEPTSRCQTPPLM